MGLTLTLKVCTVKIINVTAFLLPILSFMVKFCIWYLGDILSTKYCEISLNEDKKNALVYAVKNHYWYQMYLDDLPIWGEFITHAFTCLQRSNSRLRV